MDFYRDDDTNKIRRVVNWIVDIVVVIAFAWFTVYSFGTQIRVTGHSMVPVLETDQVVLMNRLVYDFKKPERFDIVVFQGTDGKTNIKRVIGLPGESVQIKSGLVYIDEEVLRSEGDLNKVSLAGLAENPVILGDDEYFLLGDNRDSSDDSRFVNIGNVKKNQIMGRVWMRILPFPNFGFIDR